MILFGYISQKKKENRRKGSTPKVLLKLEGDDQQRRLTRFSPVSEQGVCYAISAIRTADYRAD